MNPDMNTRLDKLLDQVEKPARYVGEEVGAISKAHTPDMGTMAFCFPDTYEIAMSHLGMKVLYDIVNRAPHLLCERVCMPWVDMADLLRQENLPLFSLETRTPLDQFQVVGFTLQYEMSYTNILEMLDLGHIPVKCSDRAEDAPIVIAGGPCAFNPEPLAAFVDAFVIGDGESATPQVMELVREKRAQHASRADILWALAQLPGVYVPVFYEAAYHEDGTLASFTPTRPDVPARVRKCVEIDLDNTPFPESMVVPYAETVHDRIVLEIMRGCTRGCRFCQAGMLYRPVRERSVDKLMDLAEKLVAATGYDEISLSSLSSGDYSCLQELVTRLMERFKDQRVGLSLPSMRLDSLIKQTLEETSEVRKSGLTLAPEAGTQRLRDVINKGVTEQDLHNAVSDAFQSGWSSVKLYFMLGLPTETDEDLLAIGDLAKQVEDAYYAVPKGQRAPGLRITASASTFVPKPFTPFQWAAQDTLPEIGRKQAVLRSALKRKSTTFNWHEPELSFLEACFARGDRRLGDVLYAAWQRGCRLDGWQQHFKYVEWMAAFNDCGLDPAFYANRERSRDELLPWDFIDAGVTKRFLLRELDNALQGIVTPDCRQGCQGCGLTAFPGVCEQ